MTERRLRVRKRSLPKEKREERSSLFARLSPKTVRDLFEAASAAHTSVDHEPRNGWSIASCTSFDIEFLPLKLVFENGDVAYTSYNGGAISDEDVIDLQECMLPLGVHCHFVNVSALSTLDDTSAIEVEPLTTADWELLEIHSDYLEQGALLSQVSVVYPNQTLTLAVGTSDTVHVRVLPFTNSSCCRLLTNTEINVIPKPRAIEPAPSTPLRVIPSWEDWSPRMEQLATRRSIPLPRVLPGSIMVHPGTLLEHLPGWKNIQNGTRTAPLGLLTNLQDGCPCVVQVIESYDVLKDHVVLHSLIQWQLNISPFDDMITIQLLTQQRERDMISRTKSALEQGEIKMVLAPVKIEWPPKEAPWRYPNCIAGSIYFTKFTTITDLDSFNASWRNLQPDYDKLPLNEGSLIALPVSMSETRQIWRVSFDTHLREENGLSHLIRLEDILDLRPVKPSPAVLSFTKTTSVITLPKHLTLYWLPVTHGIMTASFSECLYNTFSRLNFCQGVVMYGDKGMGKTHACLMLAAIARLKSAQKTVYLDCSRLQLAGDIRMNDIMGEVTTAFEDAFTSGSSLLILDNLDKLLPNLASLTIGESSSSNLQVNPVEVDQTKLLLHHLHLLAQELGSQTKLVITCTDRKSICAGLFPVNQVYEFVSLPPQGVLEMGHMLSMMIGHLLDLQSTFPPHELGRRIEGYRPADVMRLAAVVCQHLRSQMVSSMALEYDTATLLNALDVAITGFVPISRQGVRVDNNVVPCVWDKIGGLAEAKRQLTSSILHPVKYRRIYENATAQLPRGLLLFGPPGCGKSLVVPALARECNLTLITCKGPELLDKYIGASEHKVRQLFARAQAAAPSLLFFDEFEALAPRRGSDHTGVTDRVVNQLLTFLDGVEKNLDCVYVVAATSRPDKIDPALLRPGRLEKHVYIGFPATKTEWTDVFSKLALSRKVSDEVVTLIESGTLWSEMIDSYLLAYSPADLKAVLDTAQLAAVHEYLENGSKDGDIMLTVKHIRGALERTRPSLSLDDRARLEYVYASYRGIQSFHHSKQMKTALR